MSACVEVRQNHDGTFTAAGECGGVFCQVTAATRHAAVARVGGALNFKNWPSIVEDYRKDAERYRWLMGPGVLNGTLGTDHGWIDFEDKAEAEQQLDAAMALQLDNT